MADNQNPITGVDLSQAPGADISFTDLFSGEPIEPAQPASTGEPAVTIPAVQPVVADPAQPYVYTYKDRETAERGIRDKDTLIETLRQKYVADVGRDPITNQSVVRPQTPTEPHSYLKDPKSLYRDLGDLHARGDEEGWTRKLGEFVGEYVGQVIAPAAPLVLQSAKDGAVRQLEGTIPNFRTFQASSEYKETLEDLPKLKEAILIAESNLEAATQLPEFYRIAYLAAQGRGLSRAQQAQPVVPTPRTTIPTTTPTPLAPSEHASEPDIYTSEGRKLIMEL